MTFGNMIQIARDKAGLSQKELAQKLGVSASMISQYENGLRFPKFTTIQRIAEALQVDFAELIPPDFLERLQIPQGNRIFVGSDNQIYATPLETNQFSFEYALLHAFAQLNEEGKKKAVDRLVELAEIPRYQKITPQD